ncbi:MAG: ATP:cob(I)alamin adenosyltransferase [Verrucomicrobia bacterium]|nr:ATP:cob(I)alamin adenosyltransferase [Verrucomicrobiota bacterium]
MSIATRTGDRGTTGLMYNRRVPKHHPRVEAYGCVDELNAALGLARAALPRAPLDTALLAIQHDLVLLMGELATATEDLPAMSPTASGASLRNLPLASTNSSPPSKPPTPAPRLGDARRQPPSAALDLARTVCRRAERRICLLQETDQLQNDEILVYLNRLADVLWLLARNAAYSPDHNLDDTRDSGLAAKRHKSATSEAS